MNINILYYIQPFHILRIHYKQIYSSVQNDCNLILNVSNHDHKLYLKLNVNLLYYDVTQSIFLLNVNLLFMFKLFQIFMLFLLLKHKLEQEFLIILELIQYLLQYMLNLINFILIIKQHTLVIIINSNLLQLKIHQLKLLDVHLLITNVQII